MMNPHLLPATAHSYLERSATSLHEAITARDVPTRYACAHVAALCAAAALLAARARPAPRARRAAAEAGSTRAVSEREADDLVRDADRFLAVVEQALGLVPHVSVA